MSQCLSVWPLCPAELLFNYSLWPHWLQHVRFPCPSLSLGVCWTHLLSWWCHPTSSSSVVPFPCSQSFSASGLFQWVDSLLQVAKVLELQHQSLQWIFRVWFPVGLTGLISLLSKGPSSFLQHHNSKASILWHSTLWSNSYILIWLLKKTIALTIQTFVGKVNISAF